MGDQINLSKLWRSNIDKIILAAMLVIFLGFTLFLAVNLDAGIIPDEPAHFVFSNHFAGTWGIPQDSPETYARGWYIDQNPFLYYWINGRVINLLAFLVPSLSARSMLVALRIVNVGFALGTVLGCYFLAGEIFKNKWWRLLPVFLLTNILMFVFLSSGVNYDNLANLFSMAGLLFLVRVFRHKQYLNNSLLWMIMIGFGALTKYTILPLALAMALAWIVYSVINRKKIFPIKITGFYPLILIVLLAALAVGNFSIYGLNIIRHQSLTPPCEAILSQDQCAISPYVRRYQQTALREPLSIAESISQGYPSPVLYPFKIWIPNMLLRSFGAIGHQAYYPLDVILFFQVLFYWMLFLGLFNLACTKKASFTSWSLLGITFFYASVLLIMNYADELIYGFQHLSQAGRYLFPVAGGLTSLFTIILKKTPVKWVRWITLVFTLILFLYAGPLTFVRGFDSYFYRWFVN